MDSAALYVSTDVVERLTKPFGSANSKGAVGSSYDDLNRNFDTDRPVMDMAAFMGSMGSGVRNSFGENSSRARPSSAPRERYSGAAKPQLSEQEKDEKRQSFEAFMHRQKQTELRKKKHIDDVITKLRTPANHI
jgi:hypothetical protein